MATRPLPENPNLDHLRGQARALQRGVRAGEPDAVARLTPYRLAPAADFPLSSAQLVLAREYGFPSWPRLRRFLDVVAEHGWTSDPDQRREEPADEFCRRVCLTYTGSDNPSRWRVDPPARPHIWSAAAAADLSTVEELLATDPGLAARRGGPQGWRPLAYLAYSRHEGQAGDASPAVVRLLLAAGADPNEGYLWHGLPSPFTLLTGVFGEGEQGPRRQPRHPRSLELARLLLEAGADPNDGQALYNRMFTPDDDHLELLFAFGLGRGDGGVWHARVGELLPDPATMLRDLLRWAVQHGQSARARLLARHGVDVTTPYPDGRTPWELAQLAGDQSLADALVAAGARPSTMDDVAQLVAAALRADRPAVDRLRAADPGLLDRARAARPGLVVWAATRAGIEAVTLLVELGWDVNALGRGDAPVEQPWETALHHAMGAHDTALSERLLSLGADPALTDARFSATPAQWAAHTAAAAPTAAAPHTAAAAQDPADHDGSPHTSVPP